MAPAQASETWDAIVVGAGPAGCAAAYDLAAAGRRVLLLDRSEFPRPKACAGGLTIKAVRALRYPIDPVVRLWARSIVLEQSPTHAVMVGRRSPVCAMTVREELDSFCLERTRERGAQFLRTAPVSSIEQSAESALLRTADGGSFSGRYLIGADGVHSAIRQLTGSKLTTGDGWFRTGFALEANVPYRSEGERYPLTFDFAPVVRGYGWLFPRDNHVNVGLYVDGASDGRPDRESLAGYIAARCGAASEFSKPVGQFLGLGAAAYRPAPGTRVLLAGDAAGFVDPLTGEGIYGALRSGQAAAAAVNAALGAGAAFGSRPGRPRARNCAIPTGTPVERGFLAAAARLQADLRVAEFAAARFYAEPARGFALMRLPLVPRAVLRAYAEGASLDRLLRGVRLAGRLRSVLR